MSVAVCAGPGTGTAAREHRMRALFEATAGALRRYLLRFTEGRPETADDLLQETMLRAWRKLDQLPDDAESLRRWLFTVARNVAIDAVRSRTARPVEIYGDTGAWSVPVEDGTDRLLDRQVLHDALAELPESHRAVLVSLYWNDVSVADTAASLGIPEGTVRSRCFYALRTVRARLTRP